MTIEPNDPLARARADLERLRAVIVEETHWVFLTDDLRAAETLRASAGSDALFVVAMMNLTARGETFPIAVLAVGKAVWSSSTAMRVANAAAGRRTPEGDFE